MQKRKSTVKRTVTLREWTKEKFAQDRTEQTENFDKILAEMKKMTSLVQTKLEKTQKDQKAAHDSLKQHHAQQVLALEDFKKKDPLPQARIETIKTEIKEETLEIVAQMSPRGRRGGMASRGVNSEASKNALDSDDDLEHIDEDGASMKDLIKQVNEMNDKIPKRLDKFQTALEEKQKVTDARMSKKIKDSTDKTSKATKATQESVNKLKTGMTQFSTVINQIKSELNNLKQKTLKRDSKLSAAEGGAGDDGDAEEKIGLPDGGAAQALDEFQIDFGSSGPDDNADVASDNKTEKTEEDYMELYVAKELKDKLTPIEENLTERKEEFDRLEAIVKELREQIRSVDKHYNDVAKAMLSKQGIMLTEINEYNILREFQRITHKEEKAKRRAKREQSSISPDAREGSPRASIDPETRFMKKLAPIAQSRLNKKKLSGCLEQDRNNLGVPSNFYNRKNSA